MIAAVYKDLMQGICSITQSRAEVTFNHKQDDATLLLEQLKRTCFHLSNVGCGSDNAGGGGTAKTS